MSCSLLSPRGYCDVQFQVPARTGTTNTDNLEIWHVVVTDSKTGKEIHKASYHPGEIVTLNEVSSGKYDIKVFGSNGEALYSKVTNTNVKPGTVNNVDVKLEKKVDIRTGLSNLGTIKNVTGPDNINSFTASGDDNNYYVSRLYSFSDFKQDFLDLFKTVENNDNKFVQVGEYSKQATNDLAIEVTAQINRTTLKIQQYILAIKNNRPDERFTIYIEYMEPPYFENLTTNFTETIKIKKALDNYIGTIDDCMKALGTATTHDIRAHETLLPYSWQDDYMYYTRLYVFDDFITEIKNQLNGKVGNCGFHFNSIYDDPITKPLIQLGIDVVPSNFNSHNPQESFTYNLRFRSTEISKNNDLDGYAVNFNNTEKFEQFLKLPDHSFYPQNGISFTLQKSNITGLTEYSNNPEAMQFNAIVRSTDNNKNPKYYIVTPDAKTEINNLENGTYVMDIVGSDGDNILMGTSSEFTVNNDYKPFTSLPALTKVQANIKTNLDKFGTLNKIYSPKYGSIYVNVNDTTITYNIEKLYVFNDFTEKFKTLIKDQTFTSPELNNYELQNDTNFMMKLAAFIEVPKNNETEPKVTNYTMSITSGNNTNMTQNNWIESFVFDDLKQNLPKHLNAITKFNEEYNTIDATNLGTNPQIIVHDNICPYIYNSNNLNNLTYTRLYVFDSLKPEIENQISRKTGTDGWNFNIEDRVFTNKSIIQLDLHLDTSLQTPNITKTIRIYSQSLLNNSDHQPIEPKFDNGNNIDNLLNGTNYEMGSFYGN